MKHEYTDTQLQAAIDVACNEVAQIAIGFLNTLDLDPQSEVWAEETPARLDLIKSALAALPEPEPSLSQLRPIAEAGPVPEGCLRFYTYKKDGEWTPATKHRAMQDTHYIDIRLPESEPLVTKPISLPPTEGMTLRDYFAGQALNGYLASWSDDSNPTFFEPCHTAKTSYAYADAMLAAREVKP